MSDPLLGLSERIPAELVELGQVVGRVDAAWQRARRSGDDYYLDSVALNLHGFYSGLERIFVRVAETVDGVVPQGENWHQALLMQMTQEIPGIRPAVISIATSQQLSEYRGFRHVVRNVYTFRFDPAKLEKLVVEIGSVFSKTRLELLAFAHFLNSRS